MYVIKNGTLYTMGRQGVIQADILVENGKIKKIGKDLSHEGGEMIDASGKCVTPGFVDAHSHIGGIGPGTEEDLNEITNPLTPELDAYYGINPDDKNFEIALKQGITTSCLAPGSANVVCGWVMAYKSAGKDRVVKRPVAMKGAMGINPKGCYSKTNQAPMTRMAIANIMRTYLKNVKDYMKSSVKVCEPSALLKLLEEENETE